MPLRWSSSLGLSLTIATSGYACHTITMTGPANETGLLMKCGWLGTDCQRLGVYRNVCEPVKGNTRRQRMREAEIRRNWQPASPSAESCRFSSACQARLVAILFSSRPIQVFNFISVADYLRYFNAMGVCWLIHCLASGSAMFSCSQTSFNVSRAHCSGVLRFAPQT